MYTIIIIFSLVINMPMNWLGQYTMVDLPHYTSNDAGIRVTHILLLYQLIIWDYLFEIRLI